MKKALSLFFLLFLLPIVMPTHSMSTDAFFDDGSTDPAEKSPQSAQKQKFDYMSSILQRNTKPLGLKENISLRKFLSQPSLKWAMRSGSRHLLE